MTASNQNTPTPDPLKNPGNPKGGMHPSDIKNLLTFLILAFVLWSGFNALVLKPRMEAMHDKEALAAAKGKTPGTPGAFAETLVPREEIIAQSKRFKIDTSQISGTLPETGSRIDDVELKNYFTTLDGKEPVTIYSPNGAKDAYYSEDGWIGGEGITVPGKDTVWKKTSANDVLTAGKPMSFEWDNGQGLVFTRTIEVDDGYLFTIRQSVTNKGAKAVTLYPYASITRKGIPLHSTTTGYEGPVGYIGEDLHEIKYLDLLKDQKQSFEAATGWVGMSEKYWLSSIIPDQKTKYTYSFTSIPSVPKETSTFQVNTRGEGMTLAAGQTVDNVTNLFVGAKKIKTLDTYEDKIGVKHFDLAVDFGLLYFLTRPLYFFLTLFYSWVGNFGVSIIMLTFLVRLAVFPLANASYRSFAKMKKVAPRMAEIRIKYADDKVKLQQELVKLYEEERVNPMAGCFPLVLQIPVFFSVYKVISISIEMRHAPFFGWIHDLSEKDPLSVFNLFGLLHYHVPAVLYIGPWSIAMLILMLLQQRLNPPPTDVIQKDMMRFMPWVVTFVLSKFPSGLVIYWTFTNLISLLQQSVIMKQMGVPIYFLSKEKAVAHAQSHNSLLAEVTEKAKLEKQYLKDQLKDVHVEDVEEALFDAVEGKEHPEKPEKEDK